MSPSLRWNAQTLPTNQGGVGRQQQQPGRGENKFIKEVEETWRTAHVLAREELCMAQRRQKDYYDLKKRVVRFKVGDVVLRKSNAGVVGGVKEIEPSLERGVGDRRGKVPGVIQSEES